MTRKLIALVPWFALLLAMVAGPALAADAPVVGDTVTGRLALAGKTIPLPEGPWRIAASGHGSAKAANGTLFSVTAGVLLVRPDPADRAFLMVQTNALPARDGWGTSPSCEGTLFTQISESRDLHEGCTFVSFARGPHRVGTLLPALSAEAVGTLPPWALVAGFRVSDRRDMIDMRLGVSPSSPDPAAWAEGPAGLETAHAATLHRLSDWAQTARRATLAAMRAPLAPDARMPMPVLLFAADGADEHAEEPTTLTRSLYRLAGYRVMNTAIGFLASYVTGSMVTGTWVQTWNTITHSAVFMVNELVWETPPATPIINLSGPLAGRPGPPASDAPGMGAPGLGTPGMGAPGTGTLGTGTPGTGTPAIAAAPTPVVAGKQIPMPPGTWRELAREDTPQQAGAVFGRIEAGALRGLVIARANGAPTANIIGSPAQCGRTDLLSVEVAFDTPRDGYCAYVKRVIPQDEPGGEPLWAAARDRLRTEGVAVPPIMIEATGRTRTRENFLDARYYFPDSPDDPAAIIAWSSLLREPLELGARGRLPETLTGSLAALPAPDTADTARRLLLRQARAPVDRLRDAGAIDVETHDRLARAAEDSALQPEHQGWSLWSRTLVKVGTYRVAAYLDTVATTWAVTGNPAQSFTLANAHAVIKPMIAYANEIGWAGAGAGGARAALLPASFPDIGPEAR